MTNLKNKTTLFIIAFIVTIISDINAQSIVYNNFEPGNGGFDYLYNFGWTIAGNDLSDQYGVEQAMGFQSKVDCVITDIWLPISYNPKYNQLDTINISITRNLNGFPPDTTDIMEEWSINNFESWNQWNLPIHLKGNGTTQIMAGQWYWLWLKAKKNTCCIWCMNMDYTLTCPHTLRREGENWLPIYYETASAFRIEYSPVSNISKYVDLNMNEYSLGQNYPNPFNPTTKIKYSIKKSELIQIKVYNILGKEIASLVNEEKQKGNYEVEFNGSNLSSGVYFYIMKAENILETKRMILLR